MRTMAANLHTLAEGSRPQASSLSPHHLVASPYSPGSGGCDSTWEDQSRIPGTHPGRSVLGLPPGNPHDDASRSRALRELADQEKARQKSIGGGNAWSGGQQTERYLKRYIEIFREQSFAIVSMFRSIFPDVGPDAGPEKASTQGRTDDALEPLPSSLATFPLYLVDMLLETLRLYPPTVKDQASRDSLLTQVLYCAGSLGRPGGFWTLPGRAGCRERGRGRMD